MPPRPLVPHCRSESSLTNKPSEWETIDWGSKGGREQRGRREGRKKGFLAKVRVWEEGGCVLTKVMASPHMAKGIENDYITPPSGDLSKVNCSSSMYRPERNYVR